MTTGVVLSSLVVGRMMSYSAAMTRRSSFAVRGRRNCSTTRRMKISLATRRRKISLTGMGRMRS